MPRVSRVPVIRASVADDIGVFLSWASVAEMGSLYLVNHGPDTCFVAFDALPASATLGDGRISVQVGDRINLDDISFTQIGLLCPAGKTAAIEAIALERPGSSGFGLV